MTSRPSLAELYPAADSSSERAKDSFLSAMSHELRTPLNAIIGFAEIMEGEVLGPIAVDQYKDYVSDIARSGRRLLQIVEDVLEISRAETGSMVLSRREVELRHLLAEAVQPFEAECRERSIAITTALPADLIVKVDARKVRRMLACLVSNAVKFSPDNSRIRITARLDRSGMVAISICDSGIGMNPAAIEKAFVPFVQLDEGPARRFDGSGLGLPLARRLAELHGGTLLVESIPGAGTMVTVELPSYCVEPAD